jgi:hypothetical protein
MELQCHVANFEKEKQKNKGFNEERIQYRKHTQRKQNTLLRELRDTALYFSVMTRGKV